MTHTITREFLRLHGACYTDAKLDALGPPEGLPLVDVLKLAIPFADRIWVATLPDACSPAIMWEWQAMLVERALTRIEKPDPRSLAIVPLLRRLASGEAIPQTERDAAWDAASDAARAAESAADSAAARDADSAAAWAAARAAESAADSAAARDADSAAAWAAARAADSAAARDADSAAAWAAARAEARAAEENKQIHDLIALLTKVAP